MSDKINPEDMFMSLNFNGNAEMPTFLNTNKELQFWKKCLQQALKTQDLTYAMHCDKIITKLKQ